MAIAAANKGPAPSKCKRCGAPIVSEWLYYFGRWSKYCGTCQYRNLHDGLGLPMPPELLDWFSLKPALSERDFQKQLREV